MYFYISASAIVCSLLYSRYMNLYIVYENYDLLFVLIVNKTLVDQKGHSSARIHWSLMKKKKSEKTNVNLY